MLISEFFDQRKVDEFQINPIATSLEIAPGAH